ncbi:membrane lipoprotein lipid attachment site-containing protein [Saccharicrinis sp. FJH62]|uniref:membrane lipoprotein lipid attachment site-containing protein n=1 Tax=Saccharicrinis sp. FJH62 TaxID=3344657 RepID=UPI0035D4F675
MKKFIFIVFAVLLVSSCQDEPSSIKIQNSLSDAVIRNAQWGTVRVASELLPGQRSEALHLDNYYNYYDIRLPNKFPVKFYVDVDGDRVYLQTRDSFRLGIEEDIVIIIDDDTEVFNQLLEEYNY